MLLNLHDKKDDKWAFRVASSPEAGGGHIMRCLSVARELHNHQISIHFLLCKGGEYWIDRIKSYGMTASIYKSTEEIKNKKLLVDGYDFSSVEINTWGKQCKCMVFIDDNDTPPSCADMVVSSNFNIVQHCNKGKFKLKLNGSSYALLAPEYAKNICNFNTKKVESILVTCGMIDSNNFTSQILESLSKIGFDRNVTIAIGSQAHYLQEILNSIRKYNFSINIVLDSNGLYELLAKADMVIGSGGVSLLERMALGKPSVTIITAENQRNQAEWSENNGATILVDPARQGFKFSLTSAIDFLFRSENERIKISDKGANIIDGKGSKRVAKYMTLCKR